jgi:DNA-directed RNA polymerase specialized sigma24 family protein
VRRGGPEAIHCVRRHERRAAFERPLRTYLTPLRRLARAYAREPADREDLSQEIALALRTTLPSFRGDAERTWQAAEPLENS